LAVVKARDVASLGEDFPTEVQMESRDMENGNEKEAMSGKGKGHGRYLEQWGRL